MKRFLLGLALVLVGTSAEAARLGPAASGTYRQGIPSLIPPDWSRSHNRNGSEFVSPDGSAWLRLTRARAFKSNAAHMKSVAFSAGERITYLRKRPSWIVVSGFKGDRIFYRRANLACRNQTWHQLSFEYPAVQKHAFDRFVNRASHSLQMHRNDGCTV